MEVRRFVVFVHHRPPHLSLIECPSKPNVLVCLCVCVIIFFWVLIFSFLFFGIFADITVSQQECANVRMCVCAFVRMDSLANRDSTSKIIAPHTAIQNSDSCPRICPIIRLRIRRIRSTRNVVPGLREVF